MNAATTTFYRNVLLSMKKTEAPFLIGGGFALAHHTAIGRAHKDLDVFIRPRDCGRMLDLVGKAGYRTEITYSHWLAKIYQGEEYVDLIFNGGNGMAEVTDDWFEHAVAGTVLDVPVDLCASEEMIWSKAFVMERNRYDGADVAHLLRAKGRSLDWRRLVAHFGAHWRLLLSHLLLYEFIYPGEPSPAPEEIVDAMSRAWEEERVAPLAESRLCQGTLLTTTQFQVDVEKWGYEDARLRPRGTMTEQEISDWNEAIALQVNHKT